MAEREKAIRGLELCSRTPSNRVYCHNCPYNNGISIGCMVELMKDAHALLREQVPKILSLEEAIEGKNGLEIDPYVFVEAKYSKDIFIGSVSDVTHYNYPDRKFSIRESFRIDRAFPAGTVYSKTDYMKVVRCWTHIPTAEQRKEAAWDE